MSTVTVKRHDAAAATFAVRPGTSDENAIGEVWKNNSYQRKAFKVSPGDRWLDLGANVGAFSVFAHRRGADRVVSIEADEDNAAIVAANLMRNGYAPEVIRAAVMPDDYGPPTVTFFKSSRPMAQRRHSVYRPKKEYAEVTVQAIPFRALQALGCDCIKMNIEGVEVPLLSARPDLRWVRKLVLEWSFDKEPRVQVLRDVAAYLRTQFSYVDVAKKLPPEPDALWSFYPPNAFVYAVR